MTKQIVKVSNHGIWKIIYDDKAKCNPYKIVHETGYHSHVEQRYGTLKCCIYHLLSLGILD